MLYELLAQLVLCLAGVSPNRSLNPDALKRAG